jgi:hypothetical protein
MKATNPIEPKTKPPIKFAASNWGMRIRQLELRQSQGGSAAPSGDVDSTRLRRHYFGIEQGTARSTYQLQRKIDLETWD